MATLSSEDPELGFHKSPEKKRMIDSDNEEEDDDDEGGHNIFGKRTVAAAELHIRLGFLRKVFGILSAQLVLTTIFAGCFVVIPGVNGFVRSAPSMVFGGIILSIILLVAMMCKRHETPTNYILLSIWTICEAYTIGVVVSFYDKVIVLEAFVLTCAVVVALFFYTLQSKRDFTGCGPGLFAVIWVLIIAGILQMFLMSPILEFALAAGGAILFSLFIVFDLQMMMYHISPEEYILATLNIYLDIVNLFLHLLRLLQVLQRS